MKISAFWVNLVPGSALHCGDRGFNYGDGLFETLRYHQGRFQLLTAHLERLQRGCTALGIGYPASVIERQLDLVRNYLESEDIEQACLRLALSRGGGGRGYQPPDEQEPTLVCGLHAVPGSWGQAPAPVNAIHCELKLASQPLLAGIKHSNRLEQVLAAAEVAHAGVGEGILSNQRGELVCSVSGNLFAWNGQSWLTPPITDCGVAGTVRQFLLEQVAPLHGISMRVQTLPLTALDSITALATTNSLLGLRGISALAGTRYALESEVSQLYEAFRQTMEATST